jgi:hypothetical protein
MTNEEIKKMSWQVNSEHDIYDAIVGWDYHRFACVMSDNTIQIFTGMCDETYDGQINQHLDCLNDSLPYSVDDIVMWIEVPDVKKK